MARFDSFKALHQSIAAARETPETGILRLAAEIAADDDRIAAHTCRATIHDWIASRVPGALPPEAADHGTFSFRQGGSHCQAVRVLREGHDLWAVRLRSPDPSAPADAWVTEAGVGWSPGAPPVFHLRLLRASNGVDARYLEPKVPELAVRLASVLELRQFGVPVTGEPWLVNSTPDAERFCARLTDPQRRLPILALSVPDDAADPHQPALDAERLARSCLGLALVAVIPAEYAWELTDRFGRRLSVYQGAVRIYLPGFTAQANERDHRLILGLSLSDPEAIERTTNSILRSVAAMSLESQPELPFEEVRRMANAEYSGTEGAAPTPAVGEPVPAGPAPAPAPPVAAPPVVPARVAAAARPEPGPSPAAGPNPMAPPAAAVPSVPAEPPPSRPDLPGPDLPDPDLPPPEPPAPRQPFWARSVHSAPRPAARPPASTRAPAPPERPAYFPGRTPPRFPTKPPPTRLPPAEPRPTAPRAEPPPPAPPAAAAPPATPPPASAEPPAPARPTPETVPTPSAPGLAPPGTASETTSPEFPSESSPGSAGESPPAEASAPKPAETSPEPAGPGFFARLLTGLRSLFGAKPKPALALPEPKPKPPEPEPEPAPVTPEEPPPAAAPAEDEERTRLEKEVRTLSLEVDSVRRLLTRTEQEKAKSLDELAEAQERADEAERRFDLSIAQQQALADRLLDLGEDPHPQAPLPTEWARFNEWCETQLAGKVLLTPRAQREVKRAQFADVPLAARCLLWLANDFRDGRLGRKPADRRPTVEDGVHNARCGGDAFAVKWRGKSRRVDWHIKSGGSTHDPRRCLRIYYFWDSARNQAVVASMPAHIRTGMT